MRAIVTGAAGFIGSHVAELLVNSGHDVLGIDDLSGGRLENVPQGVKFRRLDTREPLDDLFQQFRPDAVYHLAAYAAEGLSHHIPVFNFENNVVATANVLNAAYRAGVHHFTFTSSIAVYGHAASGQWFNEETPTHPCDPYGVAKLACEQHIAAFYEYHGGPEFTIFRPHNVFGPRQNIADPYRNVVGIFMRCALQGQAMPIFGDGTQTRSFSYITSVARCIADAPMMQKAANQTYNVGGDQSLSVRELATRISRVVNARESIQWLPERKEVAHAHCDHNKVRNTFSHAFENEISIEQGLERMWASLAGRPIPTATECPSSVEIFDNLPPSWAERLRTIAIARPYDCDHTPPMVHSASLG